MGALPSLLEKNFEQFSGSINSIVKYGTKKHEKALHFEQNKLLLNQMANDFGFASVSSLGPTIYTISDKQVDIQFYQNKFQDYFFHLTRVSNLGHKVQSFL